MTEKNSWKTNKCLEINTFLSNTWVKKRFLKRNKKYFELNENATYSKFVE